ncbi:hypothetical protein C4577_07840 [Candidatus Parcubacteria bacterium]|nr:MAG: hypothetical protein C4577_07840 [Candidatus Parcubacteria bacterium]
MRFHITLYITTALSVVRENFHFKIIKIGQKDAKIVKRNSTEDKLRHKQNLTQNHAENHPLPFSLSPRGRGTG